MDLVHMNVVLKWCMCMLVTVQIYEFNVQKLDLMI